VGNKTTWRHVPEGGAISFFFIEWPLCRLGRVLWEVDVVYFYVDLLFDPLNRVIEDTPEISRSSIGDPPDLGYLRYEIDIVVTQRW
jgi:hypothetical protein